uniref:Uncharacterized protein n=1 Tax=Moniliophthora roreri TaxID=221103 RepID=A0A0W0G1C5_MONRR
MASTSTRYTELTVALLPVQQWIQQHQRSVSLALKQGLRRAKANEADGVEQGERVVAEGLPVL